jgi:sortase A
MQRERINPIGLTARKGRNNLRDRIPNAGQRSLLHYDLHATGASSHLQYPFGEAASESSVGETPSSPGGEIGLSRRIARLLIGISVIFCAAFVLLRASGTAASHFVHVGFERPGAGKIDRGDVTDADPNSPLLPIDFSLWSEKRIRAYGESLAMHVGSPLALLQVPKIHLNVPVFNGTDETVFSRGVGRIIGTARLGVEGNMGIAGHRDGFFRALKDVKVGDVVKLVTPDRQRDYQVKAILIVSPHTVDVLRDQGVPMLTLVTCYPFYFVGDAPQRYVLQCPLKDNGQKLGS